MYDKFIYLLYMVKKVITSKKANVHKVNSQKNKRKTRRNRKKTGGVSLYPIQESLVSMVYDGNFPGKDQEKRRETWLGDIKNLNGKSVYFFFQGTGCSNNSSNLFLSESRHGKENRKYNDEYSFLKENNIKYGAEICRGNVIQQVMTSIATGVSSKTNLCMIPPLKVSPLIRSLKILIKEIAKGNKVFLYGHSYGGTLVTRLMQELTDISNVYGRTFGSPYIRPRPRLLHFVYDKDEIIQEQNRCARDKNIVIKLDAKIPCDDGSVSSDGTHCKLNGTVQGVSTTFYHWKTQLGWAHHNAYFPIMTYVIGNIDNKADTVQEENIKEELDSAVKNSGLFGFGLRNQILTEIKGSFYSFENCKVYKCHDWIGEPPILKPECQNNEKLAKIIKDCSVNFKKSQINSIS